MKAAVYFGSSNLYQDMAVAAKSLRINGGVDKIYFLIEHDKFPYPIPEEIEVINIARRMTEWFVQDGPNWKSAWTYIGLIRVALSKVFPDLDKILSIDCDTIVAKDISDLWDLKLDDYYFAAAREPTLSRSSNGLYINAGVMMLNLAKLREDGKDDEMIRAMNEKYFYFVAQDAMNHYCRGKILEISSDYNSCRFTLPSTTPRVIHFAGSNRFGWRDQELYKQYEAMPRPDGR